MGYSCFTLEPLTRDNFLRQFYEDSGLLDIGGLRESLINVLKKTDTPTFDQAFQLLHLFLLIEIDPEVKERLSHESFGQVLLGDSFSNEIRDQLIAELHKFHRSIDLREVLRRCQKIAEAFLIDTPASNPTGDSVELWWALEALLWRAYEALKSTNILLEHGVIEDHVTLGIAQEALIRFKFLRSNPNSVRDFFAQDLYGEHLQMCRILGWAETNDVAVPDSLAKRQTAVLDRLKSLGFDIRNTEIKKRLKKLRDDLNWRKLVVLEGPSEDVFMSHPPIRYQEIFTPRDYVAHSLTQTWEAYAVIDGDSLSIRCSIDDPLHDVPPLSLFTWADFFAAQKVMRPQLLTDYDEWCRTISKGISISTQAGA